MDDVNLYKTLLCLKTRVGIFGDFLFCFPQDWRVTGNTLKSKLSRAGRA